jgi:hypothetical protein
MVGLSLRIGADYSDVEKGLSDLQNRLRSFGASIGSGVRADSFKQLNASIADVKKNLSSVSFKQISVNNPFEAVANSGKKSIQDWVNEMKRLDGELQTTTDPSRFGPLQAAFNMARDNATGLKNAVEGVGDAQESITQLGEAVNGTGLDLSKLVSTTALTTLTTGALKIVIKDIGEHFKRLRDHANNYNRIQSEIEKTNREAQKGYASEIASLNALISIAKDETLSRQQRQNAVDKANASYPELNKNLTLENINSIATAKAIDQLTKSIISKAVAEAYASKIADATVKAEEKRQALFSKTNEQLKRTLGFQQQVDKARQSGSFVSKDIVKNEQLAQERLNREVKQTEIELQDVNEELDAYTRSMRNATAASLNFTKNPPEVKAAGIQKEAEKIVSIFSKEIEKINQIPISPKINIVLPAAPLAGIGMTVPLNFTIDAPGAIKSLQEAVKLTRDQFEAKWIEEFSRRGLPLSNIKFSIDQNSADEANKQIIAYADSIQSVLETTFSNIAVAIGEGLGDALSGNGLQGMFQNLFNIIGNGLQALGKQMIIASKLIQTLKTSLGTPAGLVAGIGLVAVGQLIKNLTVGKIPGFAGGTMKAPAGLKWVGERGPELLFDPGGYGIMSNSKSMAFMNSLKGIVAPSSAAFPDYLPAHRLEGKDLLLWYARASNSNNSNF